MEYTNSEKKKEIIELYKNIVQSNKRLPIYKDFLEYNISKDTIRSRFGGIQSLHSFIRKECPELLENQFLSIEEIFSSEIPFKLNPNGKYIVTTAVSNSVSHKGFLLSLKNYSIRTKTQIVIMPCEDVVGSFETGRGIFDIDFRDPDFTFLNKSTHLNDSVLLCNMQVSSRQIRPITGLSRFGSNESSYVFASPKQFLEYTPSGNNRGSNYSIMTTGACTLPNYKTDSFLQRKTSYIAELDHKFGAVILEIINDKDFQFRQIQSVEDDGSFIDMGVKYFPNGNIENVETNLVFGDLHGTKVDTDALYSFLNILSNLKISNIFLHDVFDAYSISHHVKDITEKSIRSISGDDSLKDELTMTYNLICKIDKELKPKKINIVKSNHDEFLDRYLKSGAYVNDPKNHYLSLKIATAIFENEDVLKRAFEVVLGKKVKNNFNFLQRGDSVLIGNVECASHGDLGLNGAKPSLTSLEKVYGNCVVGHSHSVAIHRGVFRVGTLSKLDLGYNRGPSSWSHTCCLIYNNGERQLINFIGKEFVYDR